MKPSENTADRQAPARTGVSPSGPGFARRHHVALTGLAFALPFIIGFVVLYLYPIVASGFYSFTDFNLFQPPRWVGLDNYEKLISNSRFLAAVANTLVLAVVGVPLTIVIGILGAHVLNFPVRGQPLYRAVIYLPSIIPVVVGAYLWRWLLNQQYGFVNYFLSLVHLPQPSWLEEPNWARTAVILMTVWTVGSTMIIYLAALKDVPTDLYEAAEIDGAGWWRKFTSITWPTISPVTLFQVIVILINYMQLFAEPYLLAQERLNEPSYGPGDSLVTVGTYLFQNAFVFLRMGRASAMAWVLLLMTLVVTIVVFVSSRWWVHDDSN
jgi:multiple sugar transport system permease protein